ncbi:MAG: hypothetical protein KA214_10765 [Neisseriaceae bacterium]|nr:hypothetical protein [Neisseriaceae bacterium]
MPAKIMSPWRLKRLPLWLEICLMLAIKLSLLYGAWYFWFAQPVAKNMTVPATEVDTHFFERPTQSY